MIIIKIPFKIVYKCKIIRNKSVTCENYKILLRKNLEDQINVEISCIHALEDLVCLDINSFYSFNAISIKIPVIL